MRHEHEPFFPFYFLSGHIEYPFERLAGLGWAELASKQASRYFTMRGEGGSSSNDHFPYFGMKIHDLTKPMITVVLNFHPSRFIGQLLSCRRSRSSSGSLGGCPFPPSLHPTSHTRERETVNARSSSPLRREANETRPFPALPPNSRQSSVTPSPVYRHHLANSPSRSRLVQ